MITILGVFLFLALLYLYIVLRDDSGEDNENEHYNWPRDGDA